MKKGAPTNDKPITIDSLAQLTKLGSSWTKEAIKKLVFEAWINRTKYQHEQARRTYPGQQISRKWTNVTPSDYISSYLYITCIRTMHAYWTSTFLINKTIYCASYHIFINLENNPIKSITVIIPPICVLSCKLIHLCQIVTINNIHFSSICQIQNEWLLTF